MVSSAVPQVLHLITVELSPRLIQSSGLVMIWMVEGRRLTSTLVSNWGLLELMEETSWSWNWLGEMVVGRGLIP